MSRPTHKPVYFDDYYEKGNDRKRLTIVLLIIAVILCPSFALVFKIVEAPPSIFQVVLMGSFALPLVILLERNIPRFKGKLPMLYFFYFLAGTLYSATELYQKQFDLFYFAYFMGLFAVLNFGLQRFWLSLIYFLVCLVYIIYLYLITENPGMPMKPGIALVVVIGVFFSVIFFSRNQLVDNIQDYSDYLKLIVNNPGNGVVLFQIIENNIFLADYNHEALRILYINTRDELQDKLENYLTPDERRKMSSLLSMEYLYQVRTDKTSHEQIIDIKVIPLKLKTGNYFLTTIKDVTQLVRKQNELSREVLRAELAEENNKVLEREIEERIKAENKLNQEFLRTKAILESSSNTLLLTFNPEFHFSAFNSHCRQFFELHTGIRFEEGMSFEVNLQPVFSKKHLRFFRILLQNVKKGKSYQLEINFQNQSGQQVWIDTFVNPIFDPQENVSEISLVCHDITQKKQNEKEIIQSLKEKEVLLKEVHHRVKNNLQVISSILSLQSNYTKDEKIHDILMESKNRVRSMAIIHENLYRTANFFSINFSTYVKELAHNLVASYQFNKELVINLKFDISEVELNLDQAIPCGLIINEIITNSIKYAFEGSQRGEIFLSMKERENRIEIEVSDNGIGFPEDWDYLKSDSLGIQLIVTLVEQLDGKINLDNSQGIKYLINFEREKI